MNAVAHIVSRLAPEAIRRLASARRSRFAPGGPAVRGVLDVGEATEAVLARWETDLCGLLNAMTHGELAAVAARLAVDTSGRSPALRMRLWDIGAALERGGTDVAPALQPRPVVLGGHLVVQSAARGLYPPSAAWPRVLPPPSPAAPPREEPDTLDDLLAAADRAIGVRLGARGRDKGAWGLRAARLLGIVERNDREPDWRGDVEVKTVPIAMADEPALAKLQRTLWLARATVDERSEAIGGGDPTGFAGGAGNKVPRGINDRDATIVSWYLLDWDPDIARLARRYLHERPKGPAGSTTRGLYLHKRFFADAGLLASLNGAA